MASRWASSCPRPGSGRCRWSRSRAGCETGSSCSTPATGPRRCGSRRCGPPWTGASSCWTPTSRCCCCGWRPSPAGTWTWPSRCARTRPSGADAVLGLLISLIDKSLVVLDGEAAGDARYRLLDTIREYASERLEAAGESGALALRQPGLHPGAGGGDGRHDVQPRRSALAGTPGSLPPGHRRVRQLPHRVADRRWRTATRTRACGCASGCATCGLPHGDNREAATWLDRFLVLPDAEVSPPVRGRALAVRAEIAFDLQDYDTLTRCATESLELSRASGDDFPIPTALRVISQAAARAGRAGDAVTYIEEAIAAAEAAGNDWEAGLTQATKAAIRRPAGQAEVGPAGVRDRAGGAGRQQPLGRRAGRVRDGHPGQDPRRRRDGGPVLRRRDGDSSASSTPGRRSPAARPGSAGSRLPPATTTRHRRAWPRRCG